MIEVWNDKNNKEIFKKVLGLYGIDYQWKNYRKNNPEVY